MVAGPENVKWLKNGLATCGMDVQPLRLSDLPNRLGELLDVSLQVQKKTNSEYVNVRLNKRIHIDLPTSHAAGGEKDTTGEFLPFWWTAALRDCHEYGKAGPSRDARYQPRLAFEGLPRHASAAGTGCHPVRPAHSGFLRGLGGFV